MEDRGLIPHHMFSFLPPLHSLSGGHFSVIDYVKKADTIVCFPGIIAFFSC
jgi:hypothetical protein